MKNVQIRQLQELKALEGRRGLMDARRSPRVIVPASRTRQRGPSRQVRPARRTRRATARSPGRPSDDLPPDAEPL